MTRRILLGVLCVGVLGCGSDATGPTPLIASQAYWALRLNYHAVNMSLTSPYNTVQLTATPLNALGEPLSETGPVTYTAEDSTVSVDSTGLVTANYSTPNSRSATRVVARLQYQNVTLADTTVIQVTANSPTAPLATFSLQPSVGTSTTCNFNSIGILFFQTCGPLIVNATNTLEDTVSNAQGSQILIAYRTSNPRIAHIDASGVIAEADTGHVIFSASTWAYGVIKRDSLLFVIGWPKLAQVTISEITPLNSLTPVLIFEPAKTISVGGTVQWSNNHSTQPIDIVFDDSTSVGAGCVFLLCDFNPSVASGNVSPFVGYVARSFTVAGVYRYHSRLFPSSTGVIYVREGLAQ